MEIIMEKNCYQEIIDEVSKKLAQKFISEEKDLARRATLIDKDIAGIVQDIGLQTTKKVIENTRDKIVEKKTPKD
jgi:predicted hydrolase (HD superfamily)